MARSEARPSLEPLPATSLPLLLAHHQGLGLKHAVPDDLRSALEQLFGLPLQVEVWETEVLPARLDPYLPAWLDGLLGESDLRWLGVGTKRVLFALDEERALFFDAETDRTRDPAEREVRELFPPAGGRYRLDELIRFAGIPSSDLVARLWDLAWRGSATADSFSPARQGLATGFVVEPVSAGRSGPRRGRTRRSDRWRRERPFAGAWFAVRPVPPTGDPLDVDEDDRDRARIVLDRYGIVFRSLLAREQPGLRWGRLFRALRMMELGGEVVAGHFVRGIDGLQFAAHATIRHIRNGLEDDRIWWVNAIDPASVCGLGLDVRDWDLPRRVAGNHLVFHGRELVVVSQRRGATLTIRVAPDHPELPGYLDFIGVQLTRSVEPRNSIDIEQINDEPATSSPYRRGFESRFQVTRQPSCLRLTRTY
jgi:ATP-dependent Lhr-like helicase